MKVLGFGDNIIDRYVDRQILFPGGNCVNFAVFAQRLGADAAYLGVFGSDRYGDLLRESLNEEGVAIDQCLIRDGANGVTDLVVENGERVFGDWNGGGVTITQPLVLDGALLDYMGDFDLVHSSVYSSAESELPHLRDLNTLVSFDLSTEEEYREPAYLDNVCPNVDLLLISGSHMSADEANEMLVDVVRRGAGLALMTRGTAGATVWTGAEFVSGSAVSVPPEEIVDTMGCGDAFVAAFALGMLRSGWLRSHLPSVDEISACLAQASSFAAQQCYSAGAFGYGVAYEPSVSKWSDTILESRFRSANHS